MNLKKKVEFYVNNERVSVGISDVKSHISLNEFIRENLLLTGTKKMCMEGGCGVCLVIVLKMNYVTKKWEAMSVNSCLISLISCNDWIIFTVEGIKKHLGDYHTIQKLLADFNGSQCGFCSTGMIMNMLALVESKHLTTKNVEDSFGGNICRCTGYRSILESFKSVCGAALSDKEICTDIEDLCSNNSTPKEPFYYIVDGKSWIKLFHLDDLLQVLKTFENSTYMFVCGNTARGVYKNEPQAEIFVDITEINELRQHRIADDVLIFGANITLTECIELFYKISQDNEKFSYLSILADHIELIAHVSIRNIGTIAGNLMIKHKHGEFPSDIFVILNGINAKLIIVDENRKEYVVTMEEFLTLKMNGKVIYEIQLPKPLTGYHFETYKIMPRAQNSHALINAAFYIELSSDNKVKNVRLAYGCINPQKHRASQTEEFLIGKHLFDNEILQSTFRSLCEELNPDRVLPEADPLFRKNAAVCLFYKFILHIAPTNIVDIRNISGGQKLQRNISHGIQDFETKESMYPVSQTVTKVEALAQVSGEAEYIIDMPNLPNQLFAAFVLTEAAAHSVVDAVDTSAAMSLDGVVAYFDKNDIPGKNNFMPPETNFTTKEEIFCEDVIKYFNQPIGLIVAKSQYLAQRAAKLVKITYKKSQTVPLFRIRDILKANATHKIKPYETVEVAAKRGTHGKKVIKGKLDMGMQYHYHMETQCCNVIPTEDGLDVYPATQYLDLSNVAIATVLNIPVNKVNVSVRRLGGAFGAKISRNGLISCAAALAAYKLKKPVKFWLPLDINMSVIGKRFQISGDFEIRTSESGDIEKLEVEIYSDYGSGGNEEALPYVLGMMQSSYNTDTWNIKSFSTFSDNPPNTWMRAPGSAEGFLITEAMMEEAAFTIGMDPLDFRIRNIRGGKNEKLLGYIDRIKSWANIDDRKKLIHNFNKENKWRKKGLAVVPMAYNFTVISNYGIIVSVYQADGTVAIAHGGIEMGQGINTKVIQVCAYKLGIPIEKICIKPSNNLIAPNSFFSGESLTSEGVCKGVMTACDKLLKRMEPIKEQMSNPTWEELVKKCYQEHVNLCANAMASPKDPDLDSYVVYAVCASEVEVDILTGQHIVRRVDLIEDAGDSMNPKIDIGQVEGAFVMGMGYNTLEKIVLDEDGRILTNSTWQYKPPGVKDIPEDFRVLFPSNNPNPVGVLKSKAVGEPPFCLATTIPLAIRHAVASARKELGFNVMWYPIDGPSTVENTFTNSYLDYKYFTL